MAQTLLDTRCLTCCLQRQATFASTCNTLSEISYHKGTNYSCKIPKLPFKFKCYSSLSCLSGTATETCRTFTFIWCLLQFHKQHPVYNPPLSEAAVPGTLQNHILFCQYFGQHLALLLPHFCPPPSPLLSVSESSNPYRHTTDTGYIHFVTQSYKTHTVLLNPADCAHYHILKYTTNDLLYKVFPKEFIL